MWGATQQISAKLVTHCHAPRHKNKLGHGNGASFYADCGLHWSGGQPGNDPVKLAPGTCAGDNQTWPGKQGCRYDGPTGDLKRGAEGSLCALLMWAGTWRRGREDPGVFDSALPWGPHLGCANNLFPAEHASLLLCPPHGSPQLHVDCCVVVACCLMLDAWIIPCCLLLVSCFFFLVACCLVPVPCLLVLDSSISLLKWCRMCWIRTLLSSRSFEF